MIRGLVSERSMMFPGVGQRGLTFSLLAMLALFVTIRCHFIECCLHSRQRPSSSDLKLMNDGSTNTVDFALFTRLCFGLSGSGLLLC